MEDSHQRQSGELLEQQLLKDLEAMRDKLTQLSLALHDLRFMVEDPDREAARTIAADCIVRSQSGKD
jgi:hypothetical protein